MMHQNGPFRSENKLELECYLNGHVSNTSSQGALLEAGLGSRNDTPAPGPAVLQNGGRRLDFSQAHGLAAGHAISTGGEIRFVESVLSATSAILNAPLSGMDGTTVSLAGATCFRPAYDLPSVSLFEYFSAAPALNRVVRGASVDVLELNIDGDYHVLRAIGKAAEVITSCAFQPGAGGMASFPAEPPEQPDTGAPVLGHMGQIWLGTGPARLETVTAATVRIDNQSDYRNEEYGSLFPFGIVPGPRQVTFDCNLYVRDSASYSEMLQAALQLSPVSLMLQFGQEAGRLCGVWLPAVVPAIPEYLDSEERLVWRLRGSQAHGTKEDEIHVAIA
jgi:hypothetical protein